jgi:hypothetical protein
MEQMPLSGEDDGDGECLGHSEGVEDGAGETVGN